MPQVKEALEPLARELSPKLQRELLKHAGRWVATTKDRLVAVGDSASEVYAKAVAEGVEVPVIYRVSNTNEGYLL